ncbi:unnamed protein product [Larinioides sclopetarius]|uniref:Uncharacterized protein n=1 Tax=Larinioides sclopetarius TaxID=280406 RepID=A0AAV2A8W1_9ARAC
MSVAISKLCLFQSICLKYDFVNNENAKSESCITKPTCK